MANVSGALAERCNFCAYIVYSLMITGFIYPVTAHWAWHEEGWLSMKGFHDFAGGAVVHLTGGKQTFLKIALAGENLGSFGVRLFYLSSSA